MYRQNGAEVREICKAEDHRTADLGAARVRIERAAARVQGASNLPETNGAAVPAGRIRGHLFSGGPKANLARFLNLKLLAGPLLLGPRWRGNSQSPAAAANPAAQYDA